MFCELVASEKSSRVAHLLPFPQVVSLFFEQLESSSLVMRAGMDGSDVVTLFVNDRRTWAIS